MLEIEIILNKSVEIILSQTSTNKKKTNKWIDFSVKKENAMEWYIIKQIFCHISVSWCTKINAAIKKKREINPTG